MRFKEVKRVKKVIKHGRWDLNKCVEYKKYRATDGETILLMLLLLFGSNLKKPEKGKSQLVKAMPYYSPFNIYDMQIMKVRYRICVCM